MTVRVQSARGRAAKGPRKDRKRETKSFSTFLLTRLNRKPQLYIHTLPPAALRRPNFSRRRENKLRRRTVPAPNFRPIRGQANQRADQSECKNVRDKFGAVTVVRRGTLTRIHLKHSTEATEIKHLMGFTVLQGPLTADT